MLSLTRKAGERVAIGHDVIVKVLEVVAGRVRLGIEVPPGTLIRRGEAPAAALASRRLATGPALHG
jgi:carbon storage regulator CsrA